MHVDRYTLIITSRSVLLRMRNFSDKITRENQNTHFMFSTSPPPSENRAVYEIMWKNIAKPDGPQMVRMRSHAGHLRLQIHPQIIR